MYEVIFEAETPAGKAFDVALLLFIVMSVVAVMLDSVPSIRSRHGQLIRVVEWGFTIAFSIEYVLRLVCVRRPWRYALSFYGVVDLLAVLPTYLSLVFAGAQTLLVIRALRLLRVFRVFKLTHFLGEARMLSVAIQASLHKIIVFLGTVLSLVLVIGTLMYLIEGPENGFTSIPESVYWAIVTMTTVGYGDIAPRTVVGRALAAGVMILGYAIIAVPTGIVSVELSQARRKAFTARACPSCGSEGHDPDAEFCKRCGANL
jgi:voltage-gated potassium channel